MEQSGEESDQLPEEAPPGLDVDDDDGDSDSEEAAESTGAPGGEGQNTGNRKNAG